MSAKALRVSILTMLVAFALHCVPAQSVKNTEPTDAPPPETEKVLKAMADALDIPRNGGEGGGALPQIDIANRMQFWASGTGYDAGQTYKIELRESLSYNPPAVRLDMTRTGENGPAQHSIRVVREKYAWDESEVGAGLVPGKGTATPMMNADKQRLLQLWILPYGVVKAAVAAGDQTKVSSESGTTMITFPLSGELAGVTETATLDPKNLVTKVQTATNNAALKNLVVEVDYSDYGDHGEVQTDVQSPRHIVEKRNGRTVLDITVKMWDANNPYEVFPVPTNVKSAS